MSQRAGHAVTRAALFAAAATPTIVVGDPAGQHGPVSAERWPVTSNPSSSRRQKVVTIGAGKARTDG